MCILKFLLDHLLFVVCLWQSAAFLQCRGGNVEQEQDFRFSKSEITHCLEKYSLPTPPSSSGKISSRQIYYEECLRRTNASNDKDISVQSTDSKGKVCENASEGRGLSRSDGLHASFHKMGNRGRFFANVSWNPLPNKTANWTGYTLIYVMGDPFSTFYCRDLKKDATFSVITNSSFGLWENSLFWFRITSIPHVYNENQDFEFYAVLPKSDEVTHATTPSFPVYSSNLTSNTDEVTDAATPSFPVYSAKLRSGTDESNQASTSSFSGSKTSVSNVATPFNVSAAFALLIGVAGLVFWYLCCSKKPTPPFSGPGADY